MDSSKSSDSNDSKVEELHFSNKEFNELLDVKTYNQNDKNKRSKTRQYPIFIPGKWQLAVTKKFWDEHRRRCGFLFKRGRVHVNSATMEGIDSKLYSFVLKLNHAVSYTYLLLLYVFMLSSVYFKGQCKCGTQMSGVVTDLQREVIVVTCTIKESPGQCSKRPCRNPERGDIGKRMLETYQTGSIIRKEFANELMLYGDHIPPHLYDDRTFRDAKFETLKSKHLHQDVTTALCMLKSNAMANSIHNIGAYPFFLHYSTVQQLHLYCEYSKADDFVTIAIDATGKVIEKVTRPDGTLSGSLISCIQLISECHKYSLTNVFLTI